MIYPPCVSFIHLRTGYSPQGRTFLLARRRHAFWKFPSLSLAPPSLFLSVFLFLFFLFPLSRFFLLLLPRPRHQEYFLLLHGRILSGISHIHHVITVIFSALRHVALPFLLFDPFEARTCGREIHEEFVSRGNVIRKRSVTAITVSFSKVNCSILLNGFE